jgi:hypothetical protein
MSHMSLGIVWRGMCAGALVISMQGCTFEQSLQNLGVEGPPALPPIHITADSTADMIHISPHLSLYGQKATSGRVNGHTNVNSKGVYAVDTIVTALGTTYKETSGANTLPFWGRNVSWTLPSYTLGVDLEYNLTKRFSVTGSLDYTSQNAKDFLGGSFGLALRGWNGQFGTHVEAGVRFDETALTADEVVAVGNIFTTDRMVYFFRDQQRKTSVDFYAALTFATTKESWLVNGFLSLGYCSQSLRTEMVNGSGLNSSSGQIGATADFTTVAPGLSFSVGPDMRLLAGVRFVWISNWDDLTPAHLALPFVQMDISL